MAVQPNFGEAGNSIEGNAAEILEEVSRHPGARFRLEVLVGTGESSARSERSGAGNPWKEFDEFVRLWDGKLPVLPIDATSTEALYD